MADGTSGGTGIVGAMSAAPSRSRSARSARLSALLGIFIIVAACGGGGGEAPVALSADLEAGRAVYQRLCATCHGQDGEGAVGPALSAVNETFVSCDDQMLWVALGSEQWKEQVGPRLGDREITGVMPPFGQVLTEAEIAQVAAYQRHAFAGEPEDAALAACAPASGA